MDGIILVSDHITMILSKQYVTCHALDIKSVKNRSMKMSWDAILHFVFIHSRLPAIILSVPFTHTRS